MRKQGPLRHLATENSGCARLKEDKAGRDRTVEILPDSSMNAAICCGGCEKAGLITAEDSSRPEGQDVKEQAQGLG